MLYMYGVLLCFEGLVHFGSLLDSFLSSATALGAEATFSLPAEARALAGPPDAVGAKVASDGSSAACAAVTLPAEGAKAVNPLHRRARLYRRVLASWRNSVAWAARRVGARRFAWGRRARWRKRKRPEAWARTLVLGGGGPLRRCSGDLGLGAVMAIHGGRQRALFADLAAFLAEVEMDGTADELRGGGGGMGAKTTRRKRSERLLTDLAALMKQWSEEEEENDGAEDGADDPIEALYTQLEALLWQRPADPFAALQAIMAGWSSYGAHEVAWDDEQGWGHTPSAQPGWTWDEWAPWEDQAAHAASTFSSNPSAAQPTSDDGRWIEVEHRRSKKKKKQPQEYDQWPSPGAPGAKDKGQGKGKGKQSETKSIRPHDWCPRAADWQGEPRVVGSFAEIAEDPKADYVAYPTSAKDLEGLRTFIQSAEVAPDISVVVLKGLKNELEEARVDFQEIEWTEARVPGIYKGQLRVMTAFVGRCSEDAPSLKADTAAPSVPQTGSTAVLLVHADWVYNDQDWASITKNPGSRFRTWAQEAFGNVRDTWRWQLTRGPGGSQATVEGLVRVPMAKVAAAFAASGTRHGADRWFVTNVSRSQKLEGLPDLAVDWVEWDEAESWNQYANRCRKTAAGSTFGLARGRSQLGVRRAATPEDLSRPRTVRRLWRAAGVPREWAFEDVEAFIGRLGFGDVVLEERSPWRQTSSWTFRAVMQVDVDYKAVQITDGSIELTRLGREKPAGPAQVLPIEWKQVFCKGAAKDKKQVKTKNSDDGALARFATRKLPCPSATSTTAAMPVDGGADVPRLDDGKSVTKSPDDAEASESKRHKPAAAVDTPVGMTLMDNPGNGNCLFHAIADCLHAQGRSKRTAMEIRVLAATHLRTHAKYYEGFWKGDAPEATHVDIREEGFAEYIRRIGRDGAWGGSLEIAALAYTLAQPVFVFRPNDDGVRVFNGKAKGTPLALWFDKQHYQALIGAVAQPFVLGAAPATLGDHADRGGVPSTLGGKTISKLGGCTVSGPGDSRTIGRSTLGGRTKTVKKESTKQATRVTKPDQAALPSDMASTIDVGNLADADAALDSADAVTGRGDNRSRVRPSRYRIAGWYTWSCELCPLVIQKSTCAAMCKARTQHCQRSHQGQGLPGVRVADTRAFRELSPTEAFDWCCPLCYFGLPLGTRCQVSSTAFASGRDQHRVMCHRISRKDYLRQCVTQGARKAPHVMKARVRRLNAGLAQRGKQGCLEIEGWETFHWPRVLNQKAQDRPRALRVSTAWRCKDCGACTSVVAHRVKHDSICGTFTPSWLKSSRARLDDDREEAKELKHGIPEDLLDSIFDRASRALEGKPLTTCPSS